MIPKENVEALQAAVDADIQAVYARYFEICSIDNIYNFKKSTGVDPTKETVQKTYARFFEKGWFGHAIKLRLITGIPPSPELLKKYPKMAEAFA